jgi:hypothetical protein
MADADFARYGANNEGVLPADAEPPREQVHDVGVASSTAS